jgi:acetyl-CoA C-acetyltransferase
MIQAEMADVVLAGGVEHMSGGPFTVPSARWGARLQDQVFVDAMIHALRSQNNAERANNDGSFKAEIVPVQISRRKKDPPIFDRDEHFRFGLTMADLQKLPPAFIPKIGKVTAGNASGINAAAAMLVMSREKADELGSQPLARIRAVGKGARHPAIMGLSPVPAVEDLKRRSGLEISDFELVEVNEDLETAIGFGGSGSMSMTGVSAWAIEWMVTGVLINDLV